MIVGQLHDIFIARNIQEFWQKYSTTTILQVKNKKDEGTEWRLWSGTDMR